MIKTYKNRTETTKQFCPLVTSLHHALSPFAWTSPTQVHGSWWYQWNRCQIIQGKTSPSSQLLNMMTYDTRSHGQANGLSCMNQRFLISFKLTSRFCREFLCTATKESLCSTHAWMLMIHANGAGVWQLGQQSGSDTSESKSRMTETQFPSNSHRIGWWENLQESPIFDGKNHGFL